MLLNKILTSVAAVLAVAASANAQATCDQTFIDGLLLPSQDPTPTRARVIQEVGSGMNHTTVFPGLPPVLDGLNGIGVVEFERLQFTSLMVPFALSVGQKQISAQIQFESIKFNVTTYLILYGKLFPTPSYVPPGNNYYSDDFFGRSRHLFYGNYIQQLIPIPKLNYQNACPFITDSLVTGLLPAGETMQTLYQAGKLYIEDHSDFSFLAKYFRPGVYMAYPTALFYKSTTGLKPLAIKLNPNLVVTPKDGAAWKLAKIAVNSAHAGRVAIGDHLLDHFAIGPLTTSSLRTMASNHPVRVILSHLLRQAQGILAFGGKALLEPKFGYFDNIHAIGANGDISMLQYIYSFKYSFFGSNPDTEIKNRGLSKLVGDMPFIDVHKKYYDAFYTLSRDLIDIYYVNDAAVFADKELQSFAKDVSTEANLKGFPSSIPNRAALATIIAQVFFTVTVRHAVVGKPLPIKKTDVTEANLVSWLPNTRQAIDEISYITRFGRPVQASESVSTVFTAIPAIGLQGIRSPKTACAFDKFSAALDQIKKAVDNVALNDPIIKGWDAMTPAKIPNYFYN
ncbi:Mitogen-activated protein kinase 4a [Phlyctochytrium planicorne]|nr:Mitogen-activated protein kinase 4a [Phlyctochytrium planicorne]